MGCNGMASSFFPANFLLQMQTPHGHEEEGHPPTSHAAILSTTTSCTDLQDYHNGVAAAAMSMGKRSVSFSGMEVCCEDQVNGGGEEDQFSDDCSQVGEKKRRLNMEQVRTLEKNFELGNKLEPERKMQLARALGLQPRQIAIWFQNRRARWKTKQLEKDYDVLKKQFDTVKSENDSLRAHNKKLQEEIMVLKGMEIPEPINLNKETEGSCSYRSDNSSVVNLDISAAPAPEDSPLMNPNLQNKNNFFQPIRPTPAASAHHHHHQQQQQQLALGHTPSSSSSRPELPKIESGGSGGGGPPQEENFCNMFCSLEEQHSFWTAWQEQQQHNFH